LSDKLHAEAYKVRFIASIVDGIKEVTPDYFLIHPQTLRTYLKENHMGTLSYGKNLENKPTFCGVLLIESFDAPEGKLTALMELK
jgi:hypothetical protein